ncbi:MAG: hypothetical protein IT433_06950 [Phycisphaerales bacterium]|nr:hypothetical protein [Phycisphaerales bacterium]
MKMIWNAMSVVAVANLLALLGFVGWLKADDRLNADRARAVRAVFGKTLTEEATEAAKAKADLEASEKAAAEAKRKDQPPLTAEQRVALRLEATEIDRQRMERLQREVEDLRRVLATERTALDRGRAAFLAEKSAFEAASAATRRALEDGQFQKTLGVLSTMKPKDAVGLLTQMLKGSSFAPTSQTPSQAPALAAGGAASTETEAAAGEEQVVSYLDAMDEKPRGRIMTELAKTDPVLATRLLGRIRDRAQFAPVPGNAGS